MKVHEIMENASVAASTAGGMGTTETPMGVISRSRLRAPSFIVNLRSYDIYEGLTE